MILTNIGRKSAQTLSATVLAIFLTACGTTPTTPTNKAVSINVTSAAKADFSSYQTYYVLDVPPGENKVAPPKPFSRVVVEAAVRKELGARNYVETTDKKAADMLVAIQFSLKDETKFTKKTTYVRQATSGYGNGYSRGYSSGYGHRSHRSRGHRRNRSHRNRGHGNRSSHRNSGYGYGYGSSNYYGYTTIPRSTIVAEDFRQGNMLIDLIDAKTNAVVWEAHARGEGEQEPAKIEARVNIVVAGIFKRYPHVAAKPK